MQKKDDARLTHGKFRYSDEVTFRQRLFDPIPFRVIINGLDAHFQCVLALFLLAGKCVNTNNNAVFAFVL
jgi:hypothetical protein